MRFSLGHYRVPDGADKEPQLPEKQADMEHRMQSSDPDRSHSHAALRVFAWRGIGVLRSWRQLLESPRVSVRVAEGNERAPRLNVHVTGLHTPFDQFPPRRLDIRHDNLDAFLRARRHLGNAGPHDD